MSDGKKLKPFPVHGSDEEAERFVDEADLSEYDFSDFRPARFRIAKQASGRRQTEKKQKPAPAAR